MKYDGAKVIRLSLHAKEQCIARGALEQEVIESIQNGEWKESKRERLECKMSFRFDGFWSGNYYTNKDVRPIFVEELNEIVVITVYTYYN
jgi:hypothetical protein